MTGESGLTEFLVYYTFSTFKNGVGVVPLKMPLSVEEIGKFFVTPVSNGMLGVG